MQIEADIAGMVIIERSLVLRREVSNLEASVRNELEPVAHRFVMFEAEGRLIYLQVSKLRHLQVRT